MSGAQRSASGPGLSCDRFAFRPTRAHVPAPAQRQHTAIFLIASPRPQVGKSFLARLLVDFLGVDERSCAVYDLDRSGEGIGRYFPALTNAPDLTLVDGQMALFDSLVLDDGIAKVVDIGHSAFEPFFTIAEEVGFFKDVLRRSMQPVVLYAADAHDSAIRHYRELRRRFPGLLVVPVFNEAILKGQDLRADYRFVRAAGVPLIIPPLAPMLKSQMDKSRCSFADLHTEVPVAIPVGLAFELRSWTRRAFLEFRELELRLLLEKLRAALPALQL